MHEPGPRVVADSAPLQMERGVAQRQGIHAGYADIDGVRLHVQAIFGDARRTRTEKLVTPLRPVTANNVYLPTGMSNRCGEIGQNVKHVWIVVLHRAGAMIAQKMIELVFGLWKILVAATINDIDALACMRVVQTEPMLVTAGRGRHFATGRKVCAKG